MKKLEISITDTLCKYIPLDDAIRIVQDLFEFGYENLEKLKYNIIDMVVDYTPEEKAKSIAEEVISNCEKLLKI